MKNARKLLALLLTLAMLTALLAGCGSDDSKKLIGSWVKTVSLAEIGDDWDGLEEMRDMMDLSKITIDVSLVFSDDGTYSMNIIPESAEVAVDVMYEEIKPFVRKQIEEQLAINGINKTVDEYLAWEGYTLDEFIALAFDRNELINLIISCSYSGRFDASDGKLYLSNSINQEPSRAQYSCYVFEGDTLLLTEDMGGKSVTMRLNRVK